jgi:hypothetical protein
MKRAIVQVTAQLLVEMCKPYPKPRYYNVTENALPEDARAVGGRYDPCRDLFELAVQSESFEDVPLEQMLPTLPPPVFQEVVSDG